MCSLYVAAIYSGCINEYLAIDSGIYFSTNNLCLIFAAWLKASYQIQDGV